MSHRTRTTTSSSVYANTPFPDTSETSTIAVAVLSALVIILLVVLGIILWRKRRPFGMQYSITFITTCISLIQFLKNNKYERQHILVIIRKNI